MKLFLSILLFCNLLSVTIEALGARPIRGFYEVPTSEEFKHIARLPVKFKSDNYEELKTKIEFPLPQELTGVPQTVLMEKGEGNSWSGPLVNGECETQGRFFICHMKFQNLNFSLDDAEAYITSKYPKAEIKNRLSLAREFSGEPIGILTYKLSGKNAKK